MGHGITESDTMFSVREMPWHGLGAVLDDYPTSIDDALEKSGLGWQVKQGDVLVVKTPEWTDDFGVVQPPELVPAQGFVANLRDDNDEVLGIVSDDYRVVPNRDAFKFLDSLINSDLYFETAGSLNGGKRVWVLARMPEYVEVGGDETATYIYVANSHDGSMAVTAAVSPIRIVCANTLGMALRRADANAARTYRFRHTGNLEVKYAEARNVLDLAINYEKQFKEVGDKLAQTPFSQNDLEKKAPDTLFVIDDETGPRARTIREQSKENILNIWQGNGPAGDTRGNAPGTKWTAYNAVAEYADFGRIYTKRTDQVHRSFEDNNLKQRAFDLVVSA